MTEEHPNILLMKKLDLGNLADVADLFAPDFVWHYINPNLPKIEGDYVGVAGFQSFFNKLGRETRGSFKVLPISATNYGDELVVTHVRNSMTLDDRSFAIDAVVVWRVVDGKLIEAWDIPSTHTLATAA